jgi:hypothetical protein
MTPRRPHGTGSRGGVVAATGSPKLDDERRFQLVLVDRSPR